MRWMVRAILAVAVLLVLAVAALFLIPSDKIATLAAQKFQDITARELRIEGAVRPSLWPKLGISTGRVTVANAEWSTEGPMLTAEALHIELDMSALLQGAVEINAIRADQPRLVLERAPDGRENWVFGGPNGGAAEPGMPGEGTPFTLDLAEISQGQILFIDHQSNTRFALTAIDGRLRIPEFRGEALADLSARYNDQPFTLSGKIGAFAPFLDGETVGLAGKLTAGEATVDFGGQGKWQGPRLSGQVSATLGNLAEISRLAGITPPALPAGLGRDSVGFSGQVALEETGAVQVTAATLSLDQTAFQVAGDLTPGEARPKLTATVLTGRLNLAPLLAQDTGLKGGTAGAAASGPVAATPSSAGWPQQTIDASALGLMDAAITLRASSVDLGISQLGATEVGIALEASRAVIELRKVEAYQGQIAGQVVINGRNGLSVASNLRLSDLAMQPLLQDLGGFDRLMGTGNGAVELLGVGNSVDALMHSLSGTASISLGRGELRGLDIGGMIRNLDPNFVGEGQKTIFEGISASFALANGVASNSDLTLKAPYLTATGLGQIDLGNRSLDYRLRPTALSAEDGSGGVMVPLLITGPWAHLKYRLDIEGVAKEKLAAEAKELEARAKAEAERKALETLGIERQEGERMEDAAKRRAKEALEGEARRALRGLFGNN